MKKKNREITVFSLSALDLFCSAMGVFMILCFILFPYYGKKAPEPQPQPPAPAPLPPAPHPEPEPRPEPKVIVKEKLIPSLTIALHWEHRLRDTSGRESPYWSAVTCDDVDLFVQAPSENEPGKMLLYGRNTSSHPGSPARFLVDSMRGGGEVWIHPKVTPGRYKVFYSIAKKTSDRYMSITSKPSNATTRYEITDYRIVLTVVTPDGILGGTDESGNRLPPIVIPYDRFRPNIDHRELITTITVSEDGSISID